MHRTIQATGMVEVTGFVAEGLAIDIPAGVEGKDRGVASGKAFSTVVFGNLLPTVRDPPGALGDILRRKETLACHARASYPDQNPHHRLLVNPSPVIRACADHGGFAPFSVPLDPNTLGNRP
jgi:hypothetical protein